MEQKKIIDYLFKIYFFCTIKIVYLHQKLEKDCVGVVEGVGFGVKSPISGLGIV